MSKLFVLGFEISETSKEMGKNCVCCVQKVQSNVTVRLVSSECAVAGAVCFVTAGSLGSERVMTMGGSVAVV